jgi:ParB family chromosome partitioning protein
MVYVDSCGDVEAMRGLIAPDNQPKAVELGLISERKVPASKASEKPAFSQKFIDDMHAIRLAAFQTALLEKPEYLLNLFAFDRSSASGHYGCIFGLGYGATEMNKPSIEDQFVLDHRLGGEQDDDALEAEGILFGLANKGKADGFSAFREMGKKTRNAEINAFLACAFTTQSADFMALIGEEIGADIRSIWTPSAANCFKRLKGAQLDALYMSLLDLSEDASAYKAFTKSKKGKKNEDMNNLFNDPETQKALGVTADQKSRIDAWVPECF